MEAIHTYPVLDTIKSRVSVRTYKDQVLMPSQLERVSAGIHAVHRLYTTGVRIEIVEDSAGVGESRRLGTYGVIKGARYYLLGIVDGTTDARIELGFELEQVVLMLTSMGLGSCWLGGTFNQKQFAGQVQLAAQESIDIVISFGYPSDSRTFIDKTMRFLANSSSRKRLEEIAFVGDFIRPMRVYNDAGLLSRAIEAVHVAPSASNRQPWRVLIDEQCVSFYTENGYPKFEHIDLGIAMAHFYLVCLESGITVEHVVLDRPVNKHGANYIASFLRK